MRVVLVVAATGVALTVWAIASAQDGSARRGSRVTFAPTPAAGTASPGTASPGTTSPPQRPAAVPGVPNYYNQLFADSADGSAAEAGAGVVQFADGTDAAESVTVQAGFERAEGAPTANDIRQVRAQASRTPSVTTATPASGQSSMRRTRAAVTLVHQHHESPFDSRGGVTFASERALPHPSRASMPGRSSVPVIPAAAELSVSDGPAHRLAIAHADNPAAVQAVWERVGELTVGQECRCELVVRNLGAGPAGTVSVETYFPPSVRLTNADPPPEADGDRLTWTIPALAAGSEQRIAVTLIPSQGGDLPVSAVIRSEQSVATTLAVREPMLHVAVDGPEQVTIGETMSQSIVVSNPGTGTTDEVMVEISLPAGLEHGKGRTVRISIGALAANQSHSIPLTLFATQGGPQQIQVQASAGTTLHDETTASILVAAPTLSIAADGPGLRFIGRDAAYRIVVTNEGAAAANNVRVSQVVPRGFEFVSAGKGGRFESSGREIVWYVGRVEAGQSVELVAKLTAAGVGDHRHLVTVTSDGGARAETAVETTVDGTASLVVEVLDLDDPVELEAETAYEVRVRNEGTKPATNVAVVCQVPSGVQTLAARGPTNHQSQGSLLSFQPIDELEPGNTALYRIVVRGTEAGKHRFRVRLTSDSIDEPLVTEELTHYYAD